jgi:hypothetical protein
MTEVRNLRLGRVLMHGEDMAWEPESESFELRPGERAALIVVFDYREASKEKDTGRLVFAAELGDRELGRDERTFEDRSFAADDAKGFVSIPITAPQSGHQKGRYRVEARYVREPWGGKGEPEEWVLERAGDFEVRVAGATPHRV